MLHRECFNALDMEEVPDLYMTQFPLANAATIGVHKPVVLLNHEGFYDPLLTWLDDLRARGFVAQRSLDKLKVCETLGDSIVYLTNR